MYNLARKVKAGTVNADEIAVLVEFTKENGGIEYAEKRMEDYRKLCLDYIVENVKKPEISEALTAYVNYIITRKK